MILDDTQVIKRLQGPRNSILIDAEFHEARLRLHSKPEDENPRGSYKDAYLRFLKQYPENILPKDKAETFKSLVTWPVPTVATVSKAFKDLSKVHDGQNKVIEFFFKNEDLEEDFEAYRQEIEERDFWTNEAWSAVKWRINCVIGIDLSPEIKDGKPAPEMFIIDTSLVFDIKNNKNGDAEYLIWKVEPTKEDKNNNIKDIAFIYDDERYRKAVLNDNSNEWIIVIDSPHDLGYTPARQLWSDRLGVDGILKKAPHSEQLGSLDWLLFQEISERHLGLYAGFPIVTAYAEDCSYISEDGFSRCENGLVNTRTYDEAGNERIRTDNCPLCSGNALIGPGTVKEVGAPQNKEEHSMMPAVQVTDGDTDSLKWYEGSTEAKRKLFLMSVTGSGEEPTNNQAQNEKQVTGSFESKQQVLLDLAGNFEIIRAFTLDTIGRLRYGSDQYLGSAVSYGTKFFLQTEEQLLLDYNQAKVDGLPNYMLNDKRTSLNQKLFKNNPAMMSRVNLMDLLEPYPDYSTSELTSFEFIPLEKKALKVNFNDYIKRFELEHGDIVKWMNKAPINVKVSKIELILEGYLAEDMKAVEERKAKEEEEKAKFAAQGNNFGS